jgi:hypothetical protein
MSVMARIERVLKLLTGVFLLGAAGALFWEPSLPPLVTAPGGLHPASEDPGSRPSEGEVQRDAIVQANIFSLSRAAPQTRYNPYEINGDANASMFPDFVFDAPALVPEGDLVPSLYGTVLGPDGAAALMRLDPAMPGARLYRAGDRAGDYRVVEIDARSVVLSGPEGRVQLRLLRPEGPTP